MMDMAFSQYARKKPSLWNLACDGMQVIDQANKAVTSHEKERLESKKATQRICITASTHLIAVTL
jgi:hypothetical protein